MLRRMPEGPRIGIQLPEAERNVSIGEYLAMARAAEEAGFDSIWVGDHLLYRDEGPERGPLEAFTLLARSPPRPPGSDSDRSLPAPRSATRRSSPRWQPPWTRSAEGG